MGYPTAAAGALPISPRMAPRDAVAHAARATGTDFSFLMAQAQIESGGDPDARARTSSATGLFQFTAGTWLATIEKHGDRHGLGWAQDAITGGRVADPALRHQILELRRDPALASLMAGELADDNRAALSARLGREPAPAELYLAHFLGAAGAGQFLDALTAAPQASAAGVLPAAAAANRGIFYAPGGAARSVAEVMGVITAKVDRAMTAQQSAEPGLDAPWGALPGSWQTAQRDDPSTAPAAPARASMADVLAATFADGGNALPGGGQIRAAYSRFRAFGL